MTNLKPRAWKWVWHPILGWRWSNKYNFELDKIPGVYIDHTYSLEVNND